MEGYDFDRFPPMMKGSVELRAQRTRGRVRMGRECSRHFPTDFPTIDLPPGTDNRKKYPEPLVLRKKLSDVEMEKIAQEMLYNPEEFMHASKLKVCSFGITYTKLWLLSKWRKHLSSYLMYRDAATRAIRDAPEWMRRADDELQLVHYILQKDHLHEYSAVVRSVAGAALAGRAPYGTGALYGAGEANKMRTAWDLFSSLVRMKLQWLSCRGDVWRQLPRVARLSPVEWEYSGQVIMDDDHVQWALIYSVSALGRPILVLLQLAKLYKLEDNTASRELRERRWATACREYRKSGLHCPPLLLQRRWQQLKQDARQAIAAPHKYRPHLYHWLLVCRWPHVVTQALPTWQQLKARGFVYDLKEHDLEKVEPVEPEDEEDNEDYCALYKTINVELPDLKTDGQEDINDKSLETPFQGFVAKPSNTEIQGHLNELDGKLLKLYKKKTLQYLNEIATAHRKEDQPKQFKTYLTKQLKTDSKSDQSKTNVHKQSKTNLAKQSKTNMAKQSKTNVAKQSKTNVDKQSKTNVDKQSKTNVDKQFKTNVNKRSKINVGKQSKINFDAIKSETFSNNNIQTEMQNETPKQDETFKGSLLSNPDNEAIKVLDAIKELESFDPRKAETTIIFESVEEMELYDNENKDKIPMDVDEFQSNTHSEEDIKMVVRYPMQAFKKPKLENYSIKIEPKVEDIKNEPYASTQTDEFNLSENPYFVKKEKDSNISINMANSRTRILFEDSSDSCSSYISEPLQKNVSPMKFRSNDQSGSDSENSICVYVCESENIGTESEIIQPEFENIQSESENIQSASENLQSEFENIQTESENIQSESENIQSESENIQSEFENIQTESENIQSESENIGTESENIKSIFQNIQSVSENIQTESENIETESENIKSASKNIQSEFENIQCEAENFLTEFENVLSGSYKSRTLSGKVEDLLPFCRPLSVTLHKLSPQECAKSWSWADVGRPVSLPVRGQARLLPVAQVKPIRPATSDDAGKGGVCSLTTLQNMIQKELKDLASLNNCCDARSLMELIDIELELNMGQIDKVPTVKQIHLDEHRENICRCCCRWLIRDSPPWSGSLLYSHRTLRAALASVANLLNGYVGKAKYVMSEKGQILLKYGGYEYHFIHQYRSKNKQWRCSAGRCPAAVSTRAGAGAVLRPGGGHDHPRAHAGLTNVEESLNDDTDKNLFDSVTLISSDDDNEDEVIYKRKKIKHEIDRELHSPVLIDSELNQNPPKVGKSVYQNEKLSTTTVSNLVQPMPPVPLEDTSIVQRPPSVGHEEERWAKLKTYTRNRTPLKQVQNNVTKAEELIPPTTELVTVTQPPTTKPVTVTRPPTIKPVTVTQPPTTKPVTVIRPPTTKPVTVTQPPTTKPVTVTRPPTTEPVTVTQPPTTEPVTITQPPTTEPVTVPQPPTTDPVTITQPPTTEPVTVTQNTSAVLTNSCLLSTETQNVEFNIIKEIPCVSTKNCKQKNKKSESEHEPISNNDDVHVHIQTSGEKQSKPLDESLYVMTNKHAAEHNLSIIEKNINIKIKRDEDEDALVSKSESLHKNIYLYKIVTHHDGERIVRVRAPIVSNIVEKGQCGTNHIAGSNPMEAEREPDVTDNSEVSEDDTNASARNSPDVVTKTAEPELEDLTDDNDDTRQTPENHLCVRTAAPASRSRRKTGAGRGPCSMVSRDRFETNTRSRSPGNRPVRKSRVFSTHQLLTLEAQFEKNRYLPRGDAARLASLLGLTEPQIKMWFQNRRAKWKRKYSHVQIQIS